MYPFINVFGTPLPTYALCGIFGVAAALAFACVRNRKVGLKYDDILHITLYAAVGAIVGSKLLYIITAIPSVIKNFNNIEWSFNLVLSFIQYGYVFYGGLIGAVFMVFRYCRRYKVDIDRVMLVAVPVIPLFHAFGRVGCFMAGCCWGIEYSRGIAFTNSIAAPNGVAYLPIQLIEAGLNFALFLALFFTADRFKNPKNLLCVYIFAYGIMRFALEFFRGDIIRGVALLSTSQWISLLLCSIAAAFMIKSAAVRKNQTLEKTQTECKTDGV